MLSSQHFIFQTLIVKQLKLGSLWNFKACLVSWLELHFWEKLAYVGKSLIEGGLHRQSQFVCSSLIFTLAHQMFVLNKYCTTFTNLSWKLVEFQVITAQIAVIFKSKDWYWRALCGDWRRYHIICLLNYVGFYPNWNMANLEEIKAI